jgi:hypothetical protein
MNRPAILDAKDYVDYDKIPKLVSLVKELFQNIDLEPFKVDIGEKNVGTTIRWYSVIIIPHTDVQEDAYYIRYKELDEAAADLVAHAKSMEGMERLALNILEPCSVVPMHYDNYSDDDEKECAYYNLLVPLDNNGYSIVGEKLIKNKDEEPIVFDPQTYHGGMNDALDIRRNFFCKIKNEAFVSKGES